MLSVDLELPLEVDDEYWDHPDPAQAFKQPPGKPSRVSFLIALIKLMKISGVATRTIVRYGRIYCTRRL